MKTTVVEKAALEVTFGKFDPSYIQVVNSLHFVVLVQDAANPGKAQGPATPLALRRLYSHLTSPLSTWTLHRGGRGVEREGVGDGGE